jgi:hypothetical protein
MKRAKKKHDRPPSQIAALMHGLWLGGFSADAAEAAERARVQAILRTRPSAHLLKDIGLGDD